jgi:dephospho-CoA kinase
MVRAGTRASVVGVWAPREAAWLVGRRRSFPEAAAARVDAQVSDQVLRSRVDLLVENAGTLDGLRTAVDGLAGELRRRAAVP